MDLLDTHLYGLVGDDGFTRLVAAPPAIDGSI